MLVEATIAKFDEVHVAWVNSILQSHFIHELDTCSPSFSSFKACLIATAIEVLTNSKGRQHFDWDGQEKVAMAHFKKLFSSVLPPNIEVRRRVLANWL